MDDSFIDLPYYAQDGDGDGDDITVTRPEMTTGDLRRMACHIKPFPLPPQYTPTEWDGFANIDDETLLNTPPQLIAHLQRTASQGGFQVISPRQTPLSLLMSRVTEGSRQPGDLVVGSLASSSQWPTLGPFDSDHLLPDQPLPEMTSGEGLREKTLRTLPLTSASHLLDDPILACLVKGRAVVDILRRDDVQGGADEMLELLADAWGIDVGDLTDLDAFSLGIEGPLLRHAIKSDEVYPTIYAPVHQKRCISVSSNQVTGEYLHLDSAWDWRRMRVMAEAVFSMSLSIEGYPCNKITAPGDPNASLSRANVLAFRPLPCTAWWAGAHSFSVMPIRFSPRRKPRTKPKEVTSALARYTEVVRLMSQVIELGYQAATRQTRLEDLPMPSGETISSVFDASTVRNYIFEAIENAPQQIRVRLTRYMSLAKEECKIHLLTDDIPDQVVDSISVRFLTIGSTIRSKVITECVRRGYTPEDAWHDFVAQAPQRYKDMHEGNIAWTKAAMHLLFTEPTPKWYKLSHAITMTSLRDATKSSVGAVPLPYKKGSGERLLVTARWAAKEITNNFYGYYVGSSDVALAIADAADCLGMPAVAALMRESSYLWLLRARAFRGMNVNGKAHCEPNSSDFHYRISAVPMDLVIAPESYRAYSAYVTHVIESPNVNKEVKSFFREKNENKPVSEIFRDIKWPICRGRDTNLTKYCLRPHQLGLDMERSWHELVSDIQSVADCLREDNVVPASVPTTSVEREDLSPLNI